MKRKRIRRNKNNQREDEKKKDYTKPRLRVLYSNR